MFPVGCGRRASSKFFGLFVLFGVIILPAGTPAARNAMAQDTLPNKLASLNSEQRRVFDAWRSARAAFDAELDGYWSTVNAKRDVRKRKRANGSPFTLNDYVLLQAPKYTGPALPDAIAKLLAAEQVPVPEKLLPTVSEFLQSAKDAYNFTPEVTTEAEFKRRYAKESLAIGLSKDQVIKVYALETGGMGTYDMQAGIHPQKRTGKAISSALGYAQLLGANSVNELVKHGESFIKRLEDLAVAEKGGTPWRAQALRAKSAALRAMLKDVRAIPNEWTDHVRFGNTAKGLAIHALNLDADVGPWLQVIKLKGIKDTAASEAGRTSLSGPEIELMNLAGPRTGLEMLMPVAAQVPTTNFFARQGYERNTVVRERTASELLEELGRRMELGLKKSGSIEFAAAFDEAAGR